MKEHERVVLMTDVPSEGLRAGDVGTIIHTYRGGAAFEVEFVALDGETVATATLEAIQVRPVARREIANARKVA